MKFINKHNSKNLQLGKQNQQYRHICHLQTIISPVNNGPSGLSMIRTIFVILYDFESCQTARTLVLLRLQDLQQVLPRRSRKLWTQRANSEVRWIIKCFIPSKMCK
ncbi:hypothetical protein ILYODFUR_014536 [Ilyodon furcidens]|uniref:Uncharacterized protein n=1 Tax=Ilyodon furcidens TaxID=33524 RepID=A0ABV0VEA9_9TELE